MLAAASADPIIQPDLYIFSIGDCFTGGGMVAARWGLGCTAPPPAGLSRSKAEPLCSARRECCAGSNWALGMLPASRVRMPGAARC
jgi:hypothetical protein